MSKELKTLKDLDWSFYPDEGRMAKEELKAEAVKWVKLYEKIGKVSSLEIIEKQEKTFEKEGKICFNNEEEMWVTAKIISFITFFNLTSEDLK